MGSLPRTPGSKHQLNLAGFLTLARERVAEIEAAARQAHEDLDQTAGEMGVEALLSGSPGPRERLAAELVASVTERIAGLYGNAAALVALLERSTALLPPDDKRRAPASDPHNRAKPATVHEPATDQHDGPIFVPEGVRLLVSQMAVAGSSPSEIEDSLRNEFNIVDPKPLVDEVRRSARVPDR